RGRVDNTLVLACVLAPPSKLLLMEIRGPGVENRLELGKKFLERINIFVRNRKVFFEHHMDALSGKRFFALVIPLFFVDRKQKWRNEIFAGPDRSDMVVGFDRFSAWEHQRNDEDKKEKNSSLHHPTVPLT